MSYELGMDDIPAETMDSTVADDAGQSSTAPETGATTQEPQMFEYQASGKTISEDMDTILKRASQGYNYAQHISEHKNNVTSFEQDRDRHMQEFGQWKQYHDYASENPQWAEFVRGQWEERQSFGQPQETAGTEQPAQTQVDPEMRAFMDEYRNDKKLRQEADEDSALNEQIQTVQKEFPDFDLSHTDPETGTSLEMKVLEHARANGINSFKAAFKDMMFDDLMNRKVTAAKEAAAKEIAERTKKGFISENDTSLNNLSMPARNSGSLQDELMAEARTMGILN